MVGLGVVLAGDVGDGKGEGASQLAAGPMQRVEAGAAAGVLSAHLADDDFRIGVDVEGLSFQRYGALQSFHERHIFCYVVVLVADPFGDTDGTVFAAGDDHPNTRWPRISQGATVYIGHEV